MSDGQSSGYDALELRGGERQLGRFRDGVPDGPVWQGQRAVAE